MVVTFHGKENKPKPPGIAVSNHISGHDSMVIASDIQHGQRYLYTITGQQHYGAVGFAQKQASVSYFVF